MDVTPAEWNPSFHFQSISIYIDGSLTKAPIGPKTVLYNGTVIIHQLAAAEKFEFCHGGGIGINHGNRFLRLFIRDYRYRNRRSASAKTESTPVDYEQ